MLRGRRGREQRLEELAHDAERELPLELAAARRQHAEPRGLRDRPRLGEQAGLADPGAALDRCEPPVPVARGVEERAQRGDVGLALEERRGRAAPGRRGRRVAGTRARQVAELERVQALGAVAALDHALAQVAQARARRHLVLDDAGDRAREQRLPAAREGADVRREVDRHADVAAAARGAASPVLRPIRTRTRTAAGHSSRWSARCASAAAATAAPALRKTTKNASPRASTSIPPCRANAARRSSWCRASSSP